MAKVRGEMRDVISESRSRRPRRFVPGDVSGS
jgi:hypothetical protein